MVYQRDLNGRSMYRILPITKEKIEEYLGLKPAGRGSDPLPSGILTNRQLVQSAIDGGCTNVDQVLEWVPKHHHTKVGRRDAERCLKELS